MELELTENEARVLGCLIEKSVTTPDYYPLSLGSLTGACNQKSSREPVMNLTETEVLSALDGLIGKHLASEKTPSGSRVTKYSHRLSNTLGLTYDFSNREVGLLCLLMLRGPQTVGELRGRSARLCTFDSLEQVEATLAGLIERKDGPYVIRLARLPGRKESRFGHLLCGEPEQSEQVTPGPTPIASSQPPQNEGRLDALEREVSQLRAELNELKQRLGE